MEVLLNAGYLSKYTLAFSVKIQFFFLFGKEENSVLHALQVRCRCVCVRAEGEYRAQG